MASITLLFRYEGGLAVVVALHAGLGLFLFRWLIRDDVKLYFGSPARGRTGNHGHGMDVFT